MDKVEVLKITDVRKHKDEDYTSKQINILQEVVNIDESSVLDHAGNTFVVEIENVIDSRVIKDAVYAGAKKMEMYRTDFNADIAEDIGTKTEGQWIGFSERGVAYFASKYDAEICEEMLHH